jgi:GNAT superfamily N-acetyltransferase
VKSALMWREEALTRHHDRSSFDCGVPALNEYLRRYSRQNHESGGAKTFVAVAPEAPATVLGYYSISPGAVAFAKMPAAVTKKLGRYELPVFRLGRLAVALPLQGRGLGGDLLLAAGERALRVAQQVGGVALAIEAKDERAAAWYQRFGALRLLDDPLKLVLPLETIRAALHT